MDVMAIIIIMMLVTYTPRLLPMYFFKEDAIPAGIKQFLSYIPYAALGALILPGSISAINGKPGISAIAILCSAVIAWYNRNIILTVFLTVVITFILIKSGITF